MQRYWQLQVGSLGKKQCGHRRGPSRGNPAPLSQAPAVLALPISRRERDCHGTRLLNGLVAQTSTGAGLVASRPGAAHLLGSPAEVTLQPLPCWEHGGSHQTGCPLIGQPSSERRPVLLGLPAQPLMFNLPSVQASPFRPLQSHLLPALSSGFPLAIPWPWPWPWPSPQAWDAPWPPLPFI